MLIGKFLLLSFSPMGAQVMDGFEMVRRYRQYEATLPVALSASSAAEPRAPMAIVGMSANTDLASQSLATDAGLNAF